MGLLRWLRCKESICQCRSQWKHRFDPWLRKILWKKKWQPTPVFLLGKSHGQKSLEGYSPKSWTRLSNWAHNYFKHQIKNKILFYLHLLLLQHASLFFYIYSSLMSYIFPSAWWTFNFLIRVIWWDIPSVSFVWEGLSLFWRIILLGTEFQFV